MGAMVAPADPLTDISGLFAIERRALLELLTELDGADWHKPTPCPEWSVLGLCTHLVGDDFSLLSRHRDGFHGTPSPKQLTAPQFIEWLDELQVEWVRAARRLSPRLVVELLRWVAAQLAEVFRLQDPRQRTARVSWAGPDPVPVWLDQVRELSEYWIHRQQLIHALGRPSELDPTLIGPILEGLRWAYPYRLAGVPARPGDAVSSEISGRYSATWHLVAGDGAWEFTPQPGPRCVARMSMSTEQAWRLLSNNLSNTEQERLDVSGHDVIVHALRQTRAIIGAPK